MKKIVFALSVLGLFVLLSCQQQKEYKYIEKVREKGVFGGTTTKEKEAKSIYASSDSAAYIEAYNEYALSLAAHERTRRELLKNGIKYEETSSPIGFKLLNSEGKDISTLYFPTKKQQEKEISDKWNKYITPTSNSQTSVTSNEPQLGDWRIDNYVDDFNEKTSVKYIRQTSFGTFSNSATTNSDLAAIIIIDNNNIRFQLLEYGSHHVKASETIQFKIKDKEGEIFEFKAFINESGYINLSSDRKKGYDSLLAALLKGGEVKFYAVRDYYGRSTYNFSFNCDYLQNALDAIKR